MNRPLSLIAIAAALSVSACSSEPEAPVTPEPTAGVEEPLPPAPPAEPTNTVGGEDERDEAVITTIPEAIRGRWGLVPADCTSTKGDAKGLLEISANQLKFYESLAKLGAIKEAANSRIHATFDYSGEGQSWTQDVVLDVRDNGKTMIRRDLGPDALPEPLKYTRCS